MVKISLMFLGLFCLSCAFNGTEKTVALPSNNLSVAFYNLDNLYDTIDNAKTNDDEFTPLGKNKWNTYRYKQKLIKLSKVLSDFDGNTSPDVLGVCEIENKAVLIDLSNTIATSKYEIVHIDSRDERGADVALLFNKQKLKLQDFKKYTPVISDDTADKTRDILWVKLVSIKSLDTFQFIVCHFPSRREGQLKSESKRIDAAKLCKKVINENCKLSTQNLIVMGDFNDEPLNKSMQTIIGAANYKTQPEASLVNLMFQFSENGEGSYRYKDKWNVLDQFLLSNKLLNNKLTHYVSNSVFIKNEKWMLQTGKFEGYPFRTYAGNRWLNGYSDHLPIGLRIQLNDKKKD